MSNSKIRDNLLIKLTLSRESTNRLGIYDVFVADNENDLILIYAMMLKFSLNI